MKNLILLFIVFFLGYSMHSTAQIIYTQPWAINDDASAPDPSAALDVKFNDKGFLIPRLTETQRDAINNPQESLLIFNTTSSCYEGFNGVSWKPFSCIPCNTVDAPEILAGTDIQEESFIANWETVNYANEYVIDVSTSPDFSTFVTGYENLSVGDTDEFLIEDLECETTYYYRVRAINVCGASENSATQSVTTGTCLCETTYDT